MSTINFLMCGKLGDMIHSLVAVKGLCQKENKKAIFHIYDLGWDFGIENTYRELYPILMQQEYMHEFKILPKESYNLHPVQTPWQNTPIEIFDKTLLEEGYVDLGAYIRSPYIFKNCWTELYSKTWDFNVVPFENKWIRYNKINTDLTDKILFHRKVDRQNPDFPYEEILSRLSHYRDKFIFVSTFDHDYAAFPYRSVMPFMRIQTLDEWFTSINSCALIISNLTSPTAIAHAMDKLRIVEVLQNENAYHCIGEEKYSNNVGWFVDKTVNNLNDFFAARTRP